jgi:GH25 family lysozyme M1 (1,4-beta-N-acetylmuramidase)
MTAPLLVDISSWQPAHIDWNAYAAWSKQVDGIARVIFRSDQGTGDKDAHFEDYWNGAVGAGIEQIGVYHYCYPNLNGPQAEAGAFHGFVGGRLRANDFLMLDYEQNVPQATADWLVQCAEELERLTGRTPYIYASLNYIETRLQDARLAKYPLVLADWTFNPDARPAVPHPFTNLVFIQYSDKGTVPGIGGNVDMDVFVGPELPPPPPPPPPDPRDAEIAQLKQQLDDANAKLADQANELEKSSAQLQQDGATITQLQQEIARLQATPPQPSPDQALIDANAEIARLNQQIATLKAELASAPSKFSPFEAEVVAFLKSAAQRFGL